MTTTGELVWGLAPIDADGNPGELTVCSETALIGSADQAAIQVPGPALLAEIRQEANGSLILECHDASVTTMVNNDEVARQAKQAVFSGDELCFGDCRYLVDVRFPPRPQRPSLRLMSGVTLAILSITLLSELFLIGWLPAQLSRQEVWGVDVARHKTLALADTLRKRSGTNPDDTEIAAATRSLLANAVDDLTIQLRDHGYAMDAAQLTACYDALLQIEKRLNALDDSTLLPPAKRINAEPFLQPLMKSVE